jgi:DNA topoisomerase-1
MQIELKKITNKYATYDKPDRLQRIVHEYEMANLKVAKLCNHQRQVSSSSTKQTDKINEQIKVLQSKIGSLKRKSNKTEAITRRINAMSLKLKNYKNKKTKMIEGKTLSGSTSKTNYIDPRITVAFVKTNGLEIEKFFNKAHLDTFKWATVVDENFKF